MAKKPTFNDLMNGHQSDLKRIYKTDTRGLEQAARKHMDGATAAERRAFYEKVFNNRNKK